MATPDWLASTERVVGANHPILANTKDRCGQTIYNMLDVEHVASTGMHDARTAGIVIEQDTFTGNGVARTITLSNTGLLPKEVLVWESGVGTEKVTNGTFDSDVSGWTGFGCSLSNVAGGVSGNCCQSNFTGGAGSYFYQQITGLVIGKAYTISCYIKNGSLTGQAVTLILGESQGTGSGTGGTTGAAWAQISGTVHATATTMYISFKITGGTTGTLLIDSISLTSTGGAAPIKIDTMTDDKTQPSRYLTTAWTTDIITNLQVGSFDVEDFCNTSGVTNHYLVVGIDTTTVFTGDSGAGSDPDWIESSTANRIIADDSATVSSGNIANNVESQIWTQFIEEHTTAGAHTFTIAGYRVETLYYAGNDVDGRDITLSLTDLDIKYLAICKDGVTIVFRTESMAGDVTKADSTAAFLTNYIVSVGTGTFRVGLPRNGTGNTYIYCAIGV